MVHESRVSFQLARPRIDWQTCKYPSKNHRAFYNYCAARRREGTGGGTEETGSSRSTNLYLDVPVVHMIFVLMCGDWCHDVHVHSLEVVCFIQKKKKSKCVILCMWTCKRSFSSSQKGEVRHRGIWRGKDIKSSRVRAGHLVGVWLGSWSCG